MSDGDGIGNVEKRFEETEVDWEITDFLSYAEDEMEYKSSSFSFANTSWYFRMYPKSTVKPGFLYLYLTQIGNLKCSVEYNFGLKKLDGCVEYLTKGIINCFVPPLFCASALLSRAKHSEGLYIKWSELLLRKSELIPSDMLIVTCTLKCISNRSTRSKMSNPPKIEKFIKLDTLSENFKTLYLNKDSCDTTINVVDREFKAHRAVLIARSSVFAAMFTHETTEKKTGIVTIPDCDPESFGEFLEFLYCGKFENPSCYNTLQLYETSNKYNIQELKAFCSEFLIENLAVENICKVIILADKCDDANLLSAAQTFQ